MISVVIPVLNGEEFLGELLDAVTTQSIDEPYEVLVIDSGSTDRSLEIIAAYAGVRVISIDKSEFGHGRTRNLGVQETSGDLIAFLTQDATPASNTWLAGYRAAFNMAPKVGAAFGPHLPRDGVSPLMARLLIDHFNSFSEDGEAVVQEPGDTTYLSNSNSCIARAAWEETPFRDIAYAEDQAFGTDIMNNGWSKVFAPAAAAWHSHDYGMVESFKRYFDEYRGLNDSIGERTEASANRALQIIKESVSKDDEFLQQQGMPGWRRKAGAPAARFTTPAGWDSAASAREPIACPRVFAKHFRMSNAMTAARCMSSRWATRRSLRSARSRQTVLRRWCNPAAPASRCILLGSCRRLALAAAATQQFSG